MADKISKQDFVADNSSKVKKRWNGRCTSKVQRSGEVPMSSCWGQTPTGPRLNQGHWGSTLGSEEVFSHLEKFLVIWRWFESFGEVLSHLEKL